MIHSTTMPNHTDTTNALAAFVADAEKVTAFLGEQRLNVDHRLGSWESAAKWLALLTDREQQLAALKARWNELLKDWDTTAAEFETMRLGFQVDATKLMGIIYLMTPPDKPHCLSASRRLERGTQSPDHCRPPSASANPCPRRRLHWVA